MQPNTKKRIFNFLDKNYPIDKTQDNLIDCRFDEDLENVVEKVLGVEADGIFRIWVLKRCGTLCGYIYPSGVKYWFNNGILHRGNNKPAVIHLNGEKEYWVKGIKQEETGGNER